MLATSTRQSSEFFQRSAVVSLYLWVLLDKHSLLGSALQKLNKSVLAADGASGVPSVIQSGVNDDDSLDNSLTKSKSSKLETLGKSIEKHGHSLVSVAKIEAKQQVTIAKLQADEHAKERRHQVQTELRSSLRQLAGEKRTLVIQYAAENQKKNKLVANAIMDQIEDIDAEMKKNSDELAALEATPKKSNRTPDSAIDGED